MVKLIEESICRRNSGPKEYKYDKFNGLSVGIVVMDEQAFLRIEGKRKRCVERSLSNRVHATMHTMVRTVQHTHVYICVHSM